MKSGTGCDTLQTQKQRRRTRIYWSIKKLAKEFDMTPNCVAKLLKSLGAKKHSRVAYIWDSEEFDN